jgi:hypothetical protein
MARARFDVVTCVVARRVRYGLVVEIGPDEPGWIETEYMAGDPARPEAWPAPGTVLTAVADLTPEEVRRLRGLSSG